MLPSVISVSRTHSPPHRRPEIRWTRYHIFDSPENVEGACELDTNSCILETDFPGVILCGRGKVRVYDVDGRLLIVATDRISAFDYILPTGIPDKGRVLTQL